jgi:hypothetical protein
MEKRRKHFFARGYLKNVRKLHHTVWVWVLYYDRRSVSLFLLEYSTCLGFTTRFLLLSDSFGFLDVGRSLWREDRSVVYNCCWYSSAQSFSGPSPVGLETIFYSLRFETSFFFATYYLQGYGGGTRPRLHTGVSWFFFVQMAVKARVFSLWRHSTDLQLGSVLVTCLYHPLSTKPKT